MKRSWLLIAALVLALILVGLVVRTKFFSRPGFGAIQISSTPKTTVFIDNSQLGLTPFFSDKIEAGEHTIKLVPENTEQTLLSWEGKVQVNPNILTAINRELAPEESSSSGEILSLEKISRKDSSSLAVISTPDRAVVKFNGEPRGFAPILIEDLAPGDYQIVVSSTGYQERTIQAHTVAGYKLTVKVKLAQKIEGIEEEVGEAKEEGETKGVEENNSPEEEKLTPTPEAELEENPALIPPEKPYIKVKETPTGWLRVREEPNTNFNTKELAKIKPGEMYPYAKEEENGWYKIEYEEGEEGWVSGLYVELFE